MFLNQRTNPLAYGTIVGYERISMLNRRKNLILCTVALNAVRMDIVRTVASRVNFVHVFRLTFVPSLRNILGKRNYSAALTCSIVLLAITVQAPKLDDSSSESDIQ